MTDKKQTAANEWFDKITKTKQEDLHLHTSSSYINLAKKNDKTKAVTYFVAINNFLENTFRRFEYKNKEKAVEVYMRETRNTSYPKLPTYLKEEIEEKKNIILANSNDGYKRVVLFFSLKEEEEKN